MDKQFVILHFAYFILLISYEVHCIFELFNPLHCFSNGIKYDEFEVDFYFSSKKNYYKKFTSLDSDNIDFDPTRRTVFDIHGLIPQIYPDKITNLRNEFIEWGDQQGGINLIEVDWKKGCTDPITYVKAVVNTEWAAISIKNLLTDEITRWKGTNKSIENWGPLYFIGHSLGAHVAGQAAELMKENGVLVDRVTGLDPAGPCFHDSKQRLRLKKSNARFVDAVHTNGGTKAKFQLGLLDPVGHIDFYVNGGRTQPGCPMLRFKRESINLIQLGYQLVNKNVVCQHLRAYPVFAATLDQASKNGCKFWAVPWNSSNLITGKPRPSRTYSCDKEKCIEMGINTEHYRNSRGIYYVSTSDSWPYCNK